MTNLKNLGLTFQDAKRWCPLVLKDNELYVTKLMVSFLSFSIVNVQSTLRRNLTLMQGGTFGRGESIKTHEWLPWKSITMQWLVDTGLFINNSIILTQCMWMSVSCLFVMTFILC